MASMNAEDCAKKFWQHMCKLLGVTQHLSSAYHSQTNRGPKRTNQEIQIFLRGVINYAQKDWK